MYGIEYVHGAWAAVDWHVTLMNVVALVVVCIHRLLYCLSSFHPSGLFFARSLELNHSNFNPREMHRMDPFNFAAISVTHQSIVLQWMQTPIDFMSLVQTFFLSPINGDCKWSLCFGKTSMSSKTRINCHFPLVEINKKEHLRFPKMYAYVWVFRFISLSPIQFDISRVIYLHRKPIGYTSNEFKIMLAFFRSLQSLFCFPSTR